MKYVYSTFIAASLMALLAGCKGNEENKAEGTFEATEITVSAETAGLIMEFAPEEGDCVEAGQCVALIDTVQLHLQRQQILSGQQATLASRPDVAAQQAALQQQIANVEIERGRLQRLMADGAATQQSLDLADQQIAALKKQLHGLTSQLKTQTTALNQQAATALTQVDQINDRIERSKVKSPISGVILTKYAEAGEFATMGKPLFKMADTNRIFLRAYLTSTQLANVAVGQALTVTADFGGGVTKQYEGTVQSIATQSEFTPKNIQTSDSRANLVYAVKIAVKNDGTLKIGLQGFVSL